LNWFVAGGEWLISPRSGHSTLEQKPRYALSGSLGRSQSRSESFRKHTMSFLYGITVKRMQIVFCYSQCPYQLWNPPSILSNVRRGSLHGVIKFPDDEAYHTLPSGSDVKNAYTAPFLFVSCWFRNKGKLIPNCQSGFSCVFNLICS
jgi:hypothetical protein